MITNPVIDLKNEENSIASRLELLAELKKRQIAEYDYSTIINVADCIKGEAIPDDKLFALDNVFIPGLKATSITANAERTSFVEEAMSYLNYIRGLYAELAEEQKSAEVKEYIRKNTPPAGTPAARVLKLDELVIK